MDKFNNEKENILIKENDKKFSIVKKEWLSKNQIKKDENGEIFAMIEKENPPKSFIDFISSSAGTKELREIFGKKVFDYSKPRLLIQYLLQISTDKIPYLEASLAMTRRNLKRIILSLVMRARLCILSMKKALALY